MNKNMSYDSRKQIEKYYILNLSAKEIAERLGCSIATVYRELNRGNTHELDCNGRSGYNAETAQEIAEALRKNRGRRKTVK